MQILQLLRIKLFNHIGKIFDYLHIDDCNDIYIDVCQTEPCKPYDQGHDFWCSIHIGGFIYNWLDINFNPTLLKISDSYDSKTRKL
jgi:hypothetical protein